VNKTDLQQMMTMRVPLDVRERLAVWAAHNASSMRAEVVRSCRERMEREKREQERTAG
jgi:hypothetical protein